jgi:hypothetical protein
MNDLYDRKPQSRVRTQLEAARTAGSWMPWAGAAVAVLFWGGVLIWLVASMGIPALFALPPALLAGGFAALMAPGLAMVVAGIMARESARSAQANAIVLTSARMLLDPAEHVRSEITATAEAITRETQNAARALAETRSRLDALKQDIETSVVAALKAAEIVRTDGEVLAHKMGAERQSMTQLAESLRNQSESIAKAVPRHAQMLSEAARAAQDQVRKADETLGSRLRSLEETATHLAQRIDQLDTMGAESRKRAQNLGGALMRLDEQLVQSTRMVEAATKAGELATAATKSTAESLRDAVSDALGSALKATETINARAAQAHADANDAMERLKEAGLQAETTTRSASIAAKAQAEETEQRINQMSEFLFRAATKATNAAESGLERARARIELASQLIEQIKDGPKAAPPSSSADDLPYTRLAAEPLPPPRPTLNDFVDRQQAPAARPPAEEFPLSRPQQPAAAKSPNGLWPDRPAPAASRPAQEDFLLNRPAPFSGPSPLEHETLRPAAHKPTASGDFQSAMRDAGAGEELVLQHVAAMRRPTLVPPVAPPPQPLHSAPEPLFPADAARDQTTSWRDLLTGIEDKPAHVRDQSAGQMIDRLDRAGVRLGVVKASDLRRIASAAQQGDRHRRRAIRDIAPGEIQRVSRLLETDRDLQTAARTFIHSEEPDALRVLAVSERAREDAQPRLSAYLLLDAALGATA